MSEKKLAFTVDLGHLLYEGALFLASMDKGGAGSGVAFGYEVALGHLKKLTERAIEIGDPRILLRLYALGLIDSPVEHCQEMNTWNDEFEQLAAELGASR